MNGIFNPILINDFFRNDIISTDSLAQVQGDWTPEVFGINTVTSHGMATHGITYKVL